MYDHSQVETQKTGPLAARCAADLPLPIANPKAGHFLEAFHKWLKDRGCDIHAAELKPSTRVWSFSRNFCSQS